MCEVEVTPAGFAVSQVIANYEEKRIKARGDNRRDQFFVWKGELHYLDPGAAEICEKNDREYKTLEMDEEFILSEGPRGGNLNALQLTAILRELDAYTPKVKEPQAGKIPKASKRRLRVEVFKRVISSGAKPVSQADLALKATILAREEIRAELGKRNPKLTGDKLDAEIARVFAERFSKSQFEAQDVDNDRGEGYLEWTPPTKNR